MEHNEDEMPHSMELTIPITANITLEAQLTAVRPENTKLVIMSHPFSWLGGSLEDHVLDGLSRVFLQHGYNVLIFNSRGVGASSGRKSLTGVPESEDLKHIIQWAATEYPSTTTLVLLGYSFGALITSLCPAPQHLLPAGNITRSAHILISYPLGPVQVFLRCLSSVKYSKAITHLLADPLSNVLIVHGDRDQFTGHARYDKWISECAFEREYPSKGSSSSSGLPLRDQHDTQGRPTSSSEQRHTGHFQANMISGADHFWRGRISTEMRRLVIQWIEKLDIGEFDETHPS